LFVKRVPSKRRVWIVLEAETLTNEAANKLLKSLEEPPAHVYFLLVSDQPERVLPTIASRCQTIEFRPVADEVVAAFLGEPDAERRFTEQVTTDEKAAADEVGARLAERQQEVENTVADPGDRQWQIKRLDERARRDKARLTRLAALDAVDHLVSWLRDLLVLGQDAAAAVWNNDHLAELEESHVARPEVYLRMLDVVGETRKDLYLNVDRRLALQAMFSRFEEVWESA
jgi:DNA polymerase III gamma/tau subunit